MSTTIGPIEVGEIKAARFDFSGEAPAGASLTAPSCTCVGLSGVDLSPASVLFGLPYIEGMFVVQLIQPGVVGCNYKLRATVTDSSGLRHGITAQVKVVNG